MGTVYGGLRRNGTGQIFATIKGTLDNNMNCHGENFVDGENEYPGVYVKDYVITYHRKYQSNVELKKEVIQFFEGFKANYADGYLFTSEMGTCIWKADPITCMERYSPLYAGPGKLISSKEMPSMAYINQPDLGGQMFVELLETKMICGNMLVYTTGVDGIFILDTKSHLPFPKNKLDPLNMVITRFIQTKAGFVFRKMQMDLYRQYTSWFITACYVENEIWKMKVTELMLHPEVSGFNLLNRRKGIFSKKMGDAVYLMECKVVNVSIGTPKYCTNELPVIYNQSDYYLLPGSDVLTKRANRVTCSLLTPVMHEVEGIWLKNDGRSLQPVPAPKKLWSSIFNKSPLSFDDMRVKN